MGERHWKNIVLPVGRGSDPIRIWQHRGDYCLRGMPVWMLERLCRNRAADLGHSCVPVLSEMAGVAQRER